MIYLCMRRCYSISKAKRSHGLGKAREMTTLENTISMIRILPEADLAEIQNFAKKLIQRREANCPFALKSREDIYQDLEAAHRQIASGEYQNANEFIAEIKKEYGV